VVYALGSTPGSTAAGPVEGAVAELNAVAGAAEAAVSPAASAEAPVAVTTERRESCAPCDRGEWCEAREASDASWSSPGASVFSVLGMLTSGVLVSCALIGHHTWHTNDAEPVHSHGRRP